MKKPEELIELIEELRLNAGYPSARYDDGGKMVVYIGRGVLNIPAADAVFLLHSSNTVDRFYEALGGPDDAGVELYSFEIDDDVKTALDAHFSTVDEM